VLFSLVINVLILTPSVYMLQVMDRVLSTGHTETLMFLTLMAALAAVLMSVLDTLRTTLTIRIGGWLSDCIGPVLLETGVRARLKGEGGGGQTLRDLAQIQSFVATQGLTAFFDAPWVPFFIVIIWLLHPWLGVVALLSAVLLLALSVLNDLVTRKPIHDATFAQIAAGALADTTIRNAEVVRGMGLLPAMIARWQVRNMLSTEGMRRAGEIGGVLMGAVKFIRTFAQMGILAVGAFLVVRNELTGGGMIAASILLGRALAPVEIAMGAWKGLMQAWLAYDRLQGHLVAYPPEPERTRLPAASGHIAVRDLSFVAPKSSRPILENITFEVKPGEAVAIIGPSGAGKSTLCRLLVGLAEPSAGGVELDGSDVRHWDPRQLGGHVGFLPQDVELFEGSVRENIARMGEVDDDEVVEAARLARTHTLIQQLPDGYDTRIGDGGIRLSGGQRQRVGLARAVLGNPSIIVLDEPNANLDQAGESALAEAIGELKSRGSALIIVGHRPSTLAQADKILFIQNGTVAMFGPRHEVLDALRAAANQNVGPEPQSLRKPVGKAGGHDTEHGRIMNGGTP
jgi:ATP-binding cassette subfamily C protein/ATP-binding cassette subfamily C exporter for protease/lipase/ATP-binding cassette subfamily C protein EexD